MRVQIRSGGDGVPCWNDEAIRAHADATTEREARLSANNPDLLVIPGTISCYGCETQEYGYGTKCTAMITKTLYAVPGEVQPRAADATGWHREIPGLLTIKPDDADPTARTKASETEIVPDRPGTAPPEKRSGARRLFGRNG
jgi:hypothetical protein